MQIVNLPLESPAAMGRLRETGNRQAFQKQLGPTIAKMTLRYLKTRTVDEALRFNLGVDFRWGLREFADAFRWESLRFGPLHKTQLVADPAQLFRRLRYRGHILEGSNGPLKPR